MGSWRPATVALAATALVAIGGLAALLLEGRLGGDDRADVAASPDLQGELESMRSELRGLRRAQAGLRHASSPEGIGRGEPAGEPATDEPLDDREARPTDPAARIALEEERADRRVAGIDAALRAESVDVRWASEAEQTIRDVADDREIAGSRVDALECRSTLCRVDVQHESEDAQEQFPGPFLTRLGSLPQGMVRRYPAVDGSGYRSVVFLAREGHRLPRSEAQ